MTGSLRVRGAGRELVADGSRQVVIGRDTGADIASTCDRVSRRHAVVWCDPTTGWVLDDAQSKNGTFQDGQRVGRVVVDRPLVVWLGHPVDGEAVELEPVADAARSAPAADRPQPVAVAGMAAASVYQAAATLRIGRAPDNDVVLDDLLVSRHHAELRRDEDDDGYVIVDLGSHNGIYVDGRRVSRAKLTRGSLLSVGRHLLHLVDGRLEEYVDTGRIDFAAVGLSVRTRDGESLVDDVSFSLGPDTLLAVLGPTGAGKSTLIKALAGFVPADGGTVLYNGRDLYASYAELRSRIGYVPQDDILHPELTVRSALDYAARLRLSPDVDDHERATRVSEVMGELGLTERADLPIHQLSGGQRKRTSVALELLAQPSLLILDEPTSGLDPGYERSVMELLRTLADAGRTVVVVTHSVQSLDVCDRTLFLAPGGVPAYFGSPGSVAAWFGVRDHADVFRRLENEPPAQWRAPSSAGTATVPNVPTAAATGPAPAQSGWFGQVGTLSRRYLAIIRADRRNLGLLLLQAPLVAVLLFVTLPSDGMRVRGLINGRTGLVIGNLVLAVTFVGMTNAIREIVKELAVYRRERAVGLSVSAYITSKALVLGVFTVVQAALLTLAALARQGGPNDALTPLGSARAEVVIALAMTGVASMALGLLISTLVRTPDKALVLLPVVLLGSFILSSPTLDVAKKPGFKQISQLTATKWGFSAVSVSAGFYTLINRPDCEGGPAAETADSQALKKLQTEGLSLSVPDCDFTARHRASSYYLDLGALSGLTLAQLVLAGVLLRRQDPARKRRR